MDNFDVIILAGQSNAEGNGIMDMTEEDGITDKAYELVDKNPAYIYTTENGGWAFELTVPTETVLKRAAYRTDGKVKYADLSGEFANAYAQHCLKGDRKILIVKTPIGGTGFTKKQWGVGNILSDRLFTMVDKALALGGDNKVVGLLWHQGEHDAFERADKTAKEIYDYYTEKFTEQMLAIRARYGNMPIIAGEFVNEWADANKRECDAVETATKDVLRKLGNSAVVSSEGLMSNNQKCGNGDGIHFCADSVKELGKRYYEAFINVRR